jgi:tape measure domain-containing protein
MADVNLGRASLSVTADLSGFTSALDNAAKQTDKLSTANNIVVTSSNNVTTSLDHQTKSVQELQDAAVSNSILIKNMNLTAQATKLATDNLVLLDGATLLYLKDEKELAFQQAKLNTGFKELETNLFKNDAAFRNNSLLIELNTQKQRNLALENKASMAAMLALDDQAIGYAANQKTLSTELDIATRKLDLQARQMNIDTGATKALHDELVKLEEQEKALAAQEDKVKGINQPVAAIEPPAKVDTNTAEFVKGQINLKSETDMATKALELQARQMNIDSGATKKLYEDMQKLEAQEKKIIALENKAKGIIPPPPIPIKPPPIPVNKNTAEFVLNAKKMAAETDILNKKLDMQARQMAIDSGAAVKLAKELSALEKAEKKLNDTEVKLGIKKPEEKKAVPKTGMKITDMLGIGFFTAAFTKVFDGAMALVKSLVTGVIDLGAKIIESGSKFQELDRRLSAMTGFAGLATGLQTIMKSGPSASFTALGESATRLAALKFRPDAIQGLIKNFNSLSVALGNPEKILALITDKIADMVADGGATMAALGKLSEEGIQVFEALAKSMGVSVDEAKRRVTQGLVTVTQATQAISDAANMPAMLAAAEASANSFSGIWNRVTNNIEVLFQNIGVSILKGFGLVSLNTSINNFFESLSNKAAEFAPMLEKFGAVIAMISAKVLDSIESFLTQWVVTTEKMTVEEMLGEIEIVAERIVKSAIDFITELRPFVEILVAGAKQMLKIADGLGNMKKNMELDAKAAGDLFKPKQVDNIDTFTIMELMDLQNEVMANIDEMDEQIKEVVDTRFNGTGGSFMTDLEEAIEASRISIEAQLAKINDMPLIQEAPRWQKFLDENLSPLQTYQNEIEKLNMLMADGSEQGFQAFAIGSAGALAKLKSSMGVSAEPKFASAITRGSAEDFKATIDMQSKNKDVQQEIKELMALANQLQQEQLEAQQAIARAILAQRPAQVLAFCGPV